VIKGKLGNPLFHAFLKGTEQAGLPYTEDMNGYQQEGVGVFDMNIHKGNCHVQMVIVVIMVVVVVVIMGSYYIAHCTV
jgi:choline dehydrogenase-like flavoprotein